jgi:hypothetical protein
MKISFSCVSLWMYLSLVPEWLKVFYSYLIYTSLSIIRQCPSNVNIPPLEIEAIQMGPKIQSCDFHKSGHNEFDSVLVVYGDPLPK